MANYKISGVWKMKGTITHYAFHLIQGGDIYRGIKTSKEEALKILSNPLNAAVTWLWDYRTSYWKDGEKVTVVNGSYLRSNPDITSTDNLAHLINYDWL